jgi:hypothetical protein
VKTASNGRPPAEPPRQAAAPFAIDPNTAYRPEHIEAGLGIPLSGIMRDIRGGKLKASKRRGRLFILGAWVLAWLEDGEVRRRRHSAVQDLNYGHYGGVVLKAWVGGPGFSGEHVAATAGMPH